jgi:hypothetical protein
MTLKINTNIIGDRKFYLNFSFSSLKFLKIFKVIVTMPFGEWVQQEAKIKQREASLHSCSGLALSSSGILACINSSQAKTPYLESEYTCSIFNTTTSQRVTVVSNLNDFHPKLDSYLIISFICLSGFKRN